MSPTNETLPAAFRAPGVVRAITSAAATAMMAAGASTVFGEMGPAAMKWHDPMPGLDCAAVTLVFGLAWTWITRRLPRGRWIAGSLGLAALTAGAGLTLTGATSLHIDEDHELVRTFLLGSTLGAVFWLPALVVCWLVVGLPLRHAERAAKRSLGAGEIAELVATSIIMVLSFVFLLMLPLLAQRRISAMNSVPTWDRRVAEGGFSFALVVGVASFVLVGLRVRRRRRFLAAVRAGEREGFRIERKRDGAEILLRVQMSTEGYRVAPTSDVELLELDPRGETRVGPCAMNRIGAPRV